MQKRYEQLIDLVHQVKPRTIVEIGVWNGMRAMQMATAALKYNDSVHYIGHDLFEAATTDSDVEEFNKKPHNTLERVKSRLVSFAGANRGFTFQLIKGNTRETLAPFQYAVDFAYIDGGHSVDTIRSDYEAVRESRVVVFDDYYEADTFGACPDLSLFGANKIVDEIDGAQILRSGDKVAGGGHICLAVVRKSEAVTEAA